eukprot:Skav202374  [mRNA]  locus=scaffold1406:189580:191523:+ [translate_table: standard]
MKACMEAFAMWGENEEKDGQSCLQLSACLGLAGHDLLVAGDADDYAAEAGAQRVRIFPVAVAAPRFDIIFRCCDTRPAKAPAACVVFFRNAVSGLKVLRLLRHLESEKDFNKFVARDFAGVLEQQERKNTTWVPEGAVEI